jgi:hypothetical protein
MLLLLPLAGGVSRAAVAAERGEHLAALCKELHCEWRQPSPNSFANHTLVLAKALGRARWEGQTLPLCGAAAAQPCLPCPPAPLPTGK